MEGIVKTLTKGDQTLEHSRYIDDMGLLRDSFVMIRPADEEQRRQGYKQIKKPFWGMLKAQNFSPDDPIQTFTDYTDEEYEEMFEKNKFTHLEAEKNK